MMHKCLQAMTKGFGIKYIYTGFTWFSFCTIWFVIGDALWYIMTYKIDLSEAAKDLFITVIPCNKDIDQKGLSTKHPNFCGSNIQSDFNWIQ